MTDNLDEWTESPADEARRKRYMHLIKLIEKWLNYDDDSQLEEWRQLKAAIEEHESSWRQR